MPALIKKYGFEQMERSIKRYSESIKDTDKKFILQGSTFVNARYEDYLDANFDNREEVPKIYK